LDLDSLKRLEEWRSVINYFARDLYGIHEAMEHPSNEERLKVLSAQAETTRRYLDWALDVPKTEEG
jgi:hypothetical protein